MLDSDKIEHASDEVLVAFSSKEDLLRNAKSLGRLAERADLKVRILAPIDLTDTNEVEVLQGLDWRSIGSISSGFAMYDGDYKVEIKEKLGSSRYQAFWESQTESKNPTSDENMSKMFDSLWEQSRITSVEKCEAEKERKARQEAELLQDILTHDISNYNQTALLAAELIREQLPDNERVIQMFNALSASIEGSAALVQRVRKLGKIFSSTESVALTPVDLMKSLASSLDLVRKSNPGKSISAQLVFRLKENSEPSVLADSFLDEVFVNLYGNSAKYSDDSGAFIETTVEEVDINSESSTINAHPRPISFYKISISDESTGIPDSTKKKLFSRYQKEAQGTGLGMWIAYALIVDRYHGKIAARSRLREDYTKGTIVELLIPKVPSTVKTQVSDLNPPT